MKNTSLTIFRKTSGNYTISTSKSSEKWETISENHTSPASLMDAVRNLSGEIILNEYSQSQLKTRCNFFSMADAILVFNKNIYNAKERMSIKKIDRASSSTINSFYKA
jgi:hypothetical protein